MATARSSDVQASARGVALMLGSMALLACMDAVSKVLAQDYAIIQILWVRAAIFAAFALAMTRRFGWGRAWRPWRSAWDHCSTIR